MVEPNSLNSTSRDKKAYPTTKGRDFFMEGQSKARILPRNEVCDDHRSFQDGRDSGSDNQRSRSFSGSERGYRMESTRRRENHWHRSHGRLSPDRFEDLRKDWKCKECQSWNSERNSRCATCDLHHKYDRHITRGEDSFHNQAEVDEFGRKKSSLKPNGAQDGPRWPPPFDRRSSTYVFDARSGMFYHASSQFFFDPKTKLYFGNKEQTYYTYCKDSHPPFTEYKSDNSSNLENNLEPKVETKQIISISLKTKVLSSNNATKEVKRKGETQITLSTPSFSKHHESNLNRWSERGRELAGKIPIVRTNTGQPVCLLCKRKFLDLKALETHEDLSAFHKTNEKKYGKRVRKIVEASEAEYARDRAMERRQLHGDESDLLPINRFRVSSDASISVAQPQSLDDANVGNKLLKKLGWQEGTNLGQTGVEELSGVNLRKEWERIEKITGNNINP